MLVDLSPDGLLVLTLFVDEDSLGVEIRFVHGVQFSDNRSSSFDGGQFDAVH